MGSSRGRLLIAGRRLPGNRTLPASLALEALWPSGPGAIPFDGLVHRSDRGVQYLAIVYTERLAEAGAVTSVGSRGDSYDCEHDPPAGRRQRLAESVIGLYKSELIFKRGPWRTVEDVELATLAWVHWWNTARLHSAIGHLPAGRVRALVARSDQKWGAERAEERRKEGR